MRNVSSLFESDLKVKDYREVGLTFGVPRAIVPPGTRNMVQAIDDVAVVNRDFDFQVNYADLPEFYDKFVDINRTSGGINNGPYKSGFKADENQFRLAVEIPLLEDIIFIEMSANSTWVVTHKIVGGDVVETARWSNDPYLTNFMFSTNSPGKVVFSNTWTQINSTPMNRLGRPVRNNANGRWYIPVEYFIGAGNTGKLYELDEASGTLSVLTTNKPLGGYQFRAPDIITKANRSTAYTLQGSPGVMAPFRWTWRTYLQNPAMFFWKNKILTLDSSGNLNYNTTDNATFQVIPAPPTGSMFYIVDDNDRDNRLIAAGVDGSSSNRNIVLWELRSITGSWVKIGTLIDAAYSNGYTGKLSAGTGAARDITPSETLVVPNLGSNSPPGTTTYQFWYPSGIASILPDEGGSQARLNVGFGYWHSGLYNGGPTSGEDALAVTSTDSYLTMLQVPLPQPVEVGFSSTVNNTFFMGIRKQVKGWGVVPSGTNDLNTSYINIYADYGMIYGLKHCAFTNMFQHWATSGKFPILNNQITDDGIDAFKFLPTYRPVIDFPSNLFPTFGAKLLARRLIFNYGGLSNFFIKDDYNRVDFFNTVDRNNFAGSPNYRAFCEMIDPADLKANTTASFGSWGALYGIVATGDRGDYTDVRGFNWGGVFSGPNATTIGIQTPGRHGDDIPGVSTYVWLLGANLNRKEPFTLNKLSSYSDPSSTTLYTIVG